MRLFRLNFFLFFIIILFKINTTYTSEIKIIAKVDDKIITTEDLKYEINILKFLFNLNDNEKNIRANALESLINLQIKKIEVEKNKIVVPVSQIDKYLIIVLKNYNKTLEDLRLKINDMKYENFLKNKLQIELAWNQLVMKKFSSTININIDEILAKNNISVNDTKKLDVFILQEKNKKIQALSDSYFNEIKNKTLIKIL